MAEQRKMVGAQAARVAAGPAAIEQAFLQLRAQEQDEDTG
jgi:hypothetical protein